MNLAYLCLLAALPPTDPTQPQSPPRPQPNWVKLIDYGTIDPKFKGYMLPEGVKIEVVAEEPAVVNPVGLTFGDDGTLYVLEWRPSPGDEWRETPETFTYKDGTKRAVATMKKRTKDVLKVLALNAKTGTYDKATIVLEDELPSSILLHDGWVYLASRGTVRRYKQSKPNGPYDVKEVIAQGFCGFHHHQVSGMTIGHDGWLYLTSGDDDNYVEGSDGSRSTVLRTGAVFRCRPDGSKMHAYSIGWRNPYRDLAFDANFNWFHVDNDNEDGSRFTGCRLMHVAEESDFGWRLFTGARCCRPDPARGAVFGEMPGKMPAMLKTGRGSPAGLLIYNDTQFPESYRGLLYYPDVYRRLIRAYRVVPDGSTFQVAEEFEFLKADDPLFRPCQMVAGPDGAIYVCDWRTDSGGAGKLWGDGTHGRIYRLRWAGTKEQPAIPLAAMDRWSKFAAATTFEALREGLTDPNLSVRLAAQREVFRRAKVDPKGVRAFLLGGVAADQPPALRLLSLGGLQALWDDEVRKAFVGLLNDGNADVRRLVADGLALNCAAGDAQTTAALAEALNDGNPAVKRAVALAIGRIAAPGAEGHLIAAFQADTGRDVYLADGIVRAIERLGERGVHALMVLADSGNDKWRDAVVAAFRTMRGRAAADALPTLLRNVHLTPAQRVELSKSFGNYLFDPPLGPDGLIGYLTANAGMPTEAKKAGLDALAFFGPVKNDKLTPLILAWLDDADPAMRQSAIATVERTRLADAVAVLAKRIADEKWTAFERTAIVRALRAFQDQRTLAPLVATLKSEGPSAEDRLLRLEALRSLAQLDPDAAKPFAEAILNGTDAPAKADAIQVLAAKAEGAKMVAERFLAKKLPRDLLPHVTDALRKHLDKDPNLGRLLTEVMKGGLLVSLDKAEVERVHKLVAAKGNARRGRDLYLNSKALACITCHRMEGVGGNVGPDLTRLWDTHSLEKIMESMIEPSKEIKEGFQAYKLETKKGVVHGGLLVANTAAGATIREATGREVTVAKADIEELAATKQSLMPDNVISQLNFEQFLDLVAFLKDRASQESLRGLGLDFWVVGPFPESLRTAFGPETKADPTATYGPLAWKPVAAGANGYLDLLAAMGRDHCTAYALTYVYSPKPQKATMLCGSDDHLRVWIDGKMVHEVDRSRGAKPDEDTVAVELKAGWSPVLAKVVNGAVTHGLYLRFVGEGLKVSIKPGE